MNMVYPDPQSTLLNSDLNIGDRIRINPGLLSWILAITILAFFALLNITWHKVAIPDTPEIDGYFLQADRLLSGQAYQDLYHPPLFTLLTAIFSKLMFVNTLLAGSLVSSISLAIFSLLTFGLARYYLAVGYALLAQILIGLDWLVFRMGVSAGTDALFAALALGILLLLVIRRKQPDSYIGKSTGVVLLGLLWALSFLTRYNALFFLPLIAAGIYLDKKPLRRRFYSSVLFFVTVCLVCVPWFLYNLYVNGSMFANENWRNLALALYGKHDFSYLDRAPFAGYLDVIVHDPQRVINLWKDNILYSVGIIPFLHSSSPFLALFIPLGVIIVIRRNEHGELFLLYFAGCLLSFSLSYQYFPRFLLPLLPICLLFGLVGLEKYLTDHSKYRRLRIITMEAVLITPLILTFYFGRQTILAQPKREVELLNQLVNGPSQSGSQLSVLSTFPDGDFFTRSPESLRYSWAAHYDPNFPESLVNRSVTERAEFILVSDRTTVGAIRDGRIDSVLPECWKILKSEVDASGSIRLYHNECKYPDSQTESPIL